MPARRQGRWAVAGATLAVLAAGFGGPAGAAAPRFVDVDVTYTGADLTSPVYLSDVSDDGRVVAFDTGDPFVVPEGSSHMDVFVRDVVAASTERVSATNTGGAPGRPSFGASMSSTGRFVAFESEARNLAQPTTLRNVFLRDVVRNTTTLLSVDPQGAEPNGSSDNAQISGDGRWVVFRSFASDLVPGDGNGFADVFVRDTLRGTTRLLSRAATGGGADGDSHPTGISADGRVITFESSATNILDGVEVRPGYNAYVWRSGRVAPLVVDMTGGPPNEEIWSPVLASGGGHAAFATAASDLVPGDDDGLLDVFTTDLRTGAITRLTVGAESHSGGPSITADGRLVAFYSEADDLVAGDDNGVADVFVHDAATGTIRRVSVAADGSDGNGTSMLPVVSADGSAVVFSTDATNLAPDGHTGLLWARLR